jgi:hypothetical protein
MLLIFIAFLSFLGGNSSISCLLRKLGLCVARGGPRDLFFFGGHILESNLSRAGSHDPTTVFKLRLLYSTPLFPLISRLSHIITIYHIYIITPKYS